MRTLFIALIFVVAACGGEDDPEPTYTSIAGNWEFAADRIAGEFEIFEDGGKFYVNNAGGEFTIDGVTKQIGKKTEVSMSAFVINQILIKEGETGNLIDFYYANGDVDSKYRTITFSKCNIQNGLNGEILIFSEPLIITRSN